MPAILSRFSLLYIKYISRNLDNTEILLYKLFVRYLVIKPACVNAALTRKPVLIRFFSFTGVIPAWLGKTGITGLIFFLSGNVFEVLSKDVSEVGPGGPGSHPIKMLFQIFRLNFSWDMSKMRYFSRAFR